MWYTLCNYVRFPTPSPFSKICWSDWVSQDSAYTCARAYDLLRQKDTKQNKEREKTWGKVWTKLRFQGSFPSRVIQDTLCSPSSAL